MKQARAATAQDPVNLAQHFGSLQDTICAENVRRLVHRYPNSTKEAQAHHHR